MSPRLQRWWQAGQLFRWRGHRIFFRDEGAGPLILLLHGYPTGSFDWHAVWPLLMPHHRLIAPDFLGLGFSDKPPGARYTIGMHAQCIDALLSDLNVARVHVVAHDLGVRVAQEMLARREAPGSYARIASLVLLNGAMCPDAYRPRPIQRLLASPLGAWIGPRIPRRSFDDSIRGLFGSGTQPSQELLDDFWSLLEHGKGRRVTHLVGRFWLPRHAMAKRLVGALLRSAIPLRVINGSADPNSGKHMVQRLLSLAPGVDVLSLEGVGHWPQLEQPEATAIAVAGFIGSLGASGSGAGS
jgi:pimeloyl-ACP methyl ester carboxylesterase